MDNVQTAINEYKSAASCIAHLRLKVSKSYHGVIPHWDMEENTLQGVCDSVISHSFSSLRTTSTAWSNLLF